jgi:hypothetical protein|tara:strand:+ start:1950 stop:2072 length:123 start_codon:yes stop_codon:yes gene_type:complete
LKESSVLEKIMPWKATYFKYEVLNLKLSVAKIFETKGGLN